MHRDDICTNKKLAILAKIARRMNAAGLTWAVGASLMLFLRGRVGGFHDIDIMVAEEQVAQAIGILEGLGVNKGGRPNPKYLTRHFHEFDIDGVEVDLLAGYVIVSHGLPHECPLRLEDIDSSAMVLGEAIPLHALAEWRRYYILMGKPEKAKRC
ncbi:MAG: hypothetical protein J5529_02615 [Prevotella sp.]|nr:hypothetical protein [Prevotella sp.]